VKPRISLCVIARDEEALLPDCLASARGAVDEVVVVDTGSRDATRERAAAAGARVAEVAWRDDFAAARNEALRHATGDWILQLDADERLAPGAAGALRAEVRRAGPPAGLLALHDAARLDAPAAEVLSGRARLGEPMWLPRLLQRLPDLAWEGVVHESVTSWLVAHGAAARRVGADIVHLGSVPELRRAKGKGSRNRELLARRCREQPDDVAAHGYLALELYGAGRKAEAREVAERGWAALDRAPGRLALRLAVARALLLIDAGDPSGALAAVERAAGRDGANPDLDWLAGRALQQQAARAPDAGERRRLLALAAEAHRRARRRVGQVHADHCLRGSSGWRAASGLGEALLGLGEPDAALGAFEEALHERPDLLEAKLGTADALIDLGRAADALGRLEPLLGDGPDAWALAAAAAQALSSPSDARELRARAAERSGRGFAWPRARERLGATAPANSSASPPPAEMAMPTAPSIPAATPPARATATPVAERWAVAIVSPPGYPHGEAFREVAEALHHGLRALGHDSVLGTDLASDGRRQILLGANLLAAARAVPPPGAILYNLEQVQEGSPWFGRELIELYRRHPVWDYSAANAAALERLGLPRPQVVPVGYVPELTRIAPTEEDVDVLFYGSLNERRRAVLRELEARGARVHVAFGVYGAARDRLVARSRLVLNVHFYEAKVFEIVRVSYLLANRRTVVSERGCDRDEERPFEQGVAFAEHGRLADRCLELLARPEERRCLAEAGFSAMAARPQAELLRAALAA